MRYPDIGSPLWTSDSSGTNHESSAESRLSNTLRQRGWRLVANMFHLDKDNIPSDFPEGDVALDIVGRSLSYLIDNAQTTLLPREDDPNLEKYRELALRNGRRLRMLEHVFIKGEAASHFVDVDGARFTTDNAGHIYRSAVADMRALLMGNPQPGYWDGGVIDELRSLALPYAPESDQATIQQVLDWRQQARTDRTGLGHVPLAWLPLIDEMKTSFSLARTITYFDMAPRQEIPGIGPIYTETFAFVMRQIDAQYATWLGAEE